MSVDIRNAIITRARLGFQDHGIFTCEITVTYGGGETQGVPALSLERDASSYLKQLFNVLKVDDWERIRNQAVRVRTNDGIITHLGHFLNDAWFDVRQMITLKEKEL